MIKMFHDPQAPEQPDQYEPEYTRMLEIYAALKPRRVLEIGVRHGGTLYQWMKHAPPGCEIAAVDLPDTVWGNASFRTSFAPDTWQEWADRLGVKLTAIRGDSHNPAVIAQANALGPFDFVFIDGDHSYNGVKQDFEEYASGGVIALHDIYPDSTDNTIKVFDFWAEIKGCYKTMELSSEDDQDGRGIGVVWYA